DQELQADKLGADYLAKTAYNPRNMVDVIQVLKSQEQFAADTARAQGRAQAAGPSWLASHPSNEQRLEQIQSAVKQFQGRYGDDGRTRYLQTIDGMVFGDGSQQGVIRGRNFYHEGLGIALTAPPGWTIRNASDSVALVDQQGEAALLVRLVPEQAGGDHESILRNLLKADQGRTERRTLNGMAATHFEGTVRSDQGSKPVDLTLVSGPASRQYLLVYAARNADTLRRSHALMADAEASFRPLSTADRAAAKPWRLQIVPYPAGGFAQLVRQSPLPIDAERQLRLLNGVYGGGEPRPGQPVKVVE
ncbi:MAG TPA: M48 family metalloprotease, partial [Rubrivivax sp.]